MSLLIFDILAERRIVEARDRGELTNLPGSGQPLQFDNEEPLLPVEQRIANRIMKNAGITPQVLVLRKDIAALRGRIRALTGKSREIEQRRLALLLLQLGEIRH